MPSSQVLSLAEPPEDEAAYELALEATYDESVVPSLVFRWSDERGSPVERFALEYPHRIVL